MRATTLAMVLGIFLAGVSVGVIGGARPVAAQQAPTSEAPDPYALLGHCAAQLQAMPAQVVAAVRAEVDKANAGKTLDPTWHIVDVPAAAAAKADIAAPQTTPGAPGPASRGPGRRGEPPARGSSAAPALPAVGGH